ncbi:MAG TPA: NAD(P)/FAD-dependent oxidoreductase [Candidatus Binataceae bacterium]|nr:NAD(P)/FAD-dependent oxidoreductase [Candidatus Binataceae bacterium]
MNQSRSGIYDAIVIGAGHNGLVTAGYLAKAGLKVAVFEKRHIEGGCAVTEEKWPGFKISTCAYVNSLFRPEIVADLELKKFGYEMLPRHPSSFTPLPDGRHLFLGADQRMCREQIAKFSTKDAEAYPAYEAFLVEIADLLEPIMRMIAPNFSRLGWSDFSSYVPFMLKKRAVLKRRWPEIVRLLAGSAADMLNAWFESDELKATLATDAIIGMNASPSTPGTAYVLFHHVMGECDGARGVWGYMRGGMGGLSQSIAKACRNLGVDIFTDAPVEKVLIRRSSAVGIVIKGGAEFQAKVVISNADPNVTFNRLIGSHELPAEFIENVRLINYDSASVKINLALSQLPDFRACAGAEAGPQHRGTIHICPGMRYMESAFADSIAGMPSRAPILECTIPSVIDDTLAPAGCHVMNIFVQYGPYQLQTATTWDEQREAFGDRCLDVLEEYAPNIKDAILHREVLTPLDLEREYSLTGGNIFHGRLTLDQMFSMRPVPGFSDHRTPLRGLYLCGSGTHPGGGVMGTPGLNAARQVIRDKAWRH